MTLLFMDGFDHYATADITKKWSSKSGNPIISAAAGRRGGGALYTNNYAQYVTKGLGISASTLIAGTATYVSNIVLGYDVIFSFREGTTTHLSLCINQSNGKLYVVRGDKFGGTTLVTSSNSISFSSWNYIELKSTISDTVGAVEVRVNGVTDSSMTLSGVDTRNGGTSGVVDTFELGQANSGMQGYFDDLYVCDTSGSTNNNYLGDCRIDTLFPSGDGNYTAFTPSTGTTHYTLVDESTPNTTDYNSGASSGDRDSYAFQDLTSLSSQTIYGLQVNAAALKSDSGSRSIGTMSRLSGTDKDGSGVALSTSQTYVSQIQETDPASAAWTQTNVNSAEFGVKVTA